MDYEISAEEVKTELESGSHVVLLDVREPWERQTAVIEPSTHMAMGEVGLRFNQELDPEDHIVVYCHHGVRSMNVTAWLRQQGFENVQSMRGGIDYWSKAIDSKVPLY